jgi:parvulin-like peptidyl-prolyl isomerase
MRNTPPTPRRVRSAQESKSATVRAAAAAPSRRQRSRWQREQQQQRMLYVAIVVLVGVVATIFAAGILYDNLVRANEVVAQIGPDSITDAQLLDEVRPQARAIDAQAKNLGGGSNIASYVDQQKRSLPDQILNDLVDQHIVEQEAARRGLSVSAAELDDKERQTVADFQAATNPSPTPEASPEPTSPSLAATVGALTTPTAVPTLEESGYGPALQQLLDRNSLTEGDLRKRLEQNLLRDKLSSAVGQDQVPENQEQVRPRQIRVASADQANDLLNQLQNGADFVQLAQQFSTDTATRDEGGDMGWVARGGSLTKTMEDAAFALQAGQLSDVIQDTTGFHLLQLIERDPSRPLPSIQLTTLRDKAFNDWLSSQRSSSNVKLQLEQPQKDWVLSRVGVRR